MTIERGLFVTHRRYMDGGNGGVQRCTAEYIRVLRGAGIDLDILEIAHDHRFPTRLARRIRSSPYFRPVAASYLAELERRSGAYDAVFFNQVSLAGSLSVRPRSSKSQPRRILLSHGAEITDLLHSARLRTTLPLSGRLRPSVPAALGGVLQDEAMSRRHVDAVITLSAFDAAFEVWLGTRRATWLPRIVESEALDWSPIRSRYGFVGTLDHAPNLEGLILMLEAMEAADLAAMRVRIVGGPRRIGSWLSGKYPAVDYLGPLDEAALKKEAASWRAFLHPIFCQARGCSTKLAQALGWEIPIVTTRMGRRGYVWRIGSLIEASTPAAFVAHMRRLADDTQLFEARRHAVSAARSSPTLTDVASRLAAFLKTLHARPAEARSDA